MGEPELAHLITEIKDVKLYVLDYEANAGESIRDTLEHFIRILKNRHSNIPVLVVSRLPSRFDDKNATARKRLAAFQKKLVESLNGELGKVYFLDGGPLLGSDPLENTVDGIHPNDAGFDSMARQMVHVIQELLK